MSAWRPFEPSRDEARRIQRELSPPEHHNCPHGCEACAELMGAYLEQIRMQPPREDEA